MPPAPVFGDEMQEGAVWRTVYAHHQSEEVLARMQSMGVGIDST
jgi:hypothetical protein